MPTFAQSLCWARVKYIYPSHHHQRVNSPSQPQVSTKKKTKVRINHGSLVCDQTCAGARVQAGILFSSVKRLKRSSAEAWKSASTTTVVEFTFAGSFFGFGGADATGCAFKEAPVPLAGAGVPVLLVLVLIVRSLPCVSMIALGKVASFVSIATGNRLFARSKIALTSEEASVERVQWYCGGDLKDDVRPR